MVDILNFSGVDNGTMKQYLAIGSFKTATIKANLFPNEGPTFELIVNNNLQTNKSSIRYNGIGKVDFSCFMISSIKLTCIENAVYSVSE